MGVKTPEIIQVLQEIRGTAGPGEDMTDGIYWDMTVNTDGGSRKGDGLYGSVVAMYEEFLNGPILTSPNGTKYILSVDNDGNLSTSIV